MKKPIVIVGGGVAGLTAAAYLAKAQVPFILLERNDTTGGLVQSIEREGFVFDLGIRAFENAGILKPMLRDLDIDLDFVANPVSIGIEKTWIPFTSVDSLDDYQGLLMEYFPEDRLAIEKIVAEIRKIATMIQFVYSLDNPLFEEKLKSWKTLKKVLPWLLKYKGIEKKIKNLQMPVNQFLGQFTKNQSLIDMVTQHFFTDTPTFFALSYFGMYPEYLYPLESTAALPRKLTEFILNCGGEIRKNQEVKKLDAKQKLVYTQEACIAYDQLIWAADQRILTEAHGLLLSPKCAATCESVLSYSFATTLNPAHIQGKIPAHSFYTPATEGIGSLGPFPIDKPDLQISWLRSFFQRTTYEISIPALRNPDLAKEGQCAVLVSTIFDYTIEEEFVKNYGPDLFQAIFQEEIAYVLAKIDPKLQQEELFSFISTPKFIEGKTGNWRGAISGFAFGPQQTSFSDTQQAIYTADEDIYVCGQWSFQPAGLPVSILTAKFCVDEILKRQKEISHSRGDSFRSGNNFKQ